MLLTDTCRNTDLSFAAKEAVDTDWEDVVLPHTAHLEPYITKCQWQGVCWYRKHFRLPEESLGKTIFLQLDGAMNVADVWVNGIHKSTHAGGFLPVIVDMSGDLSVEENLIAIRLDNRDNPLTGPKPLKQLDFNTYGGLYRNARLLIKDKLHITPAVPEGKAASGGIFITYPYISREKAVAEIKVHVRNGHSEPRIFRIENRIARNTETVASVKSSDIMLNAGCDTVVILNVEVTNPRLWSPADPELYLLTSQLVSGERLIEQQRTKIGLRNVEFRGKDLYVNGERTFLRGVNRHQEYPYIGYALSDNAQRRDAALIKAGGFDYVRLSHYPPSPAFLDACDSLGLFVLDAVPGWQYYNDDPRFQAQVVQTARDMIRRDRNHPCILAWEVSLNETWMPEAFIDRLCAAAREEYPGCLTAGWMEYGYDIYLQARQHRHGNDIACAKPYNVSEYGDWEYYAQNAGFNQNTWSDLKEEERTSRQLREFGERRMLQQAANLQEAHNDNLHTPAFADGYWAMFDYNRGYADDLEASGVMSLDRLSKFSYHFFSSQRIAWQKGDYMARIASYWDADSPTDIRVFSNCDEVELRLNGRTISRRQPDRGRTCDRLPHPPFTFKIPVFEPGTLTAIGYANGCPTAADSVKTPGRPMALRLRAGDAGIPVGTNDIVFLYAEIVDENGTLAHNTKGNIRFSLPENTDCRLIGDNPAPIRAGIASILLRTGAQTSKQTFTAAYSPALRASAHIHPIKDNSKF